MNQTAQPAPEGAGEQDYTHFPAVHIEAQRFLPGTGALCRCPSWVRPPVLLCPPSEDATAQKLTGPPALHGASLCGPPAWPRVLLSSDRSCCRNTKRFLGSLARCFFLEGFGIARKVFPLCKTTTTIIIFRAFLVPSLTDFADVEHSKPCACYFTPSAQLDAAPLSGTRRASLGDTSKHLLSFCQQLLQALLPKVGRSQRVTRRDAVWLAWSVSAGCCSPYPSNPAA